MKIELAQIITLITHGSKFLFSGEKSEIELNPYYSTFSTVTNLTFFIGETSADMSGKPQVIARNLPAWLSFLREEGVKYLKLDLLNLQKLPMPYATSVMTAGNAWVVQTDKKKCWQAKWSLEKEMHKRAEIWNVEYLETDNLPVLTVTPDIEIVYSELQSSLLEAHLFSKSWMLGWDAWFLDAVYLMEKHSPVFPYFRDLIPDEIENIRIRQLMAGALKAWVFGGLCSWSDMYFSDPSLEREYQRISKRLYLAVMQALITAANLTVNYAIMPLPL